MKIDRLTFRLTDDDVVEVEGIVEERYFTRFYIHGAANVTHSDSEIGRKRMELVKLLRSWYPDLEIGKAEFIADAVFGAILGNVRLPSVILELERR